MTLLDRLRQRKLFQWALAYVAAGWLVMQVVENLGGQFLWPLGIQRGITVVLGLGFPIVLVLAWYHGEKGRQRVSGPEFVILTSLILLAGVALTVFNPLGSGEPESTVASVDLGPNSIVVLPFRNMSSDPGQEFFSEGITEDLLNLLAKIPELTVISRTSAFSFKGRDDITLPEIAAQLGVAHVLEGSVRKAGNTIRIIARLIDTRTDAQLFSETYDRVYNDVFAIQDEIAAQVASGLRLTILGEMPTLRETDPQAYTLFLQARHIANSSSPDAYEKAIPMFERVLEIDPDYAPAHVELAVAYYDQAIDGGRPRDEGLRMATDAVERALAVDPDLAYARGFLGNLMTASGDWSGASLVERALRSAPYDAELLLLAGHMLTLGLGRYEEAIPVLEYARSRDPALIFILENLAIAYSTAGRWEAAATTSRMALDLSPSAQYAPVLLSMALLEMGELEEALVSAEANPIPFLRLSLVANASHALGRTLEFEEALGELQEEWGSFAPVVVALVYAQVGDVDAAFEWLDRVTRESPLALTLTFFRPFYSLHDDPRWAEYRERMGQSEEMLDAVSFEFDIPR